MKPLSFADLDVLERVAITEARQKREQFLYALDAFLTAFGAASDVASLDEIRAMFTTYEKPGMPPLSSEIEAMREER